MSKPCYIKLLLAWCSICSRFFSIERKLLWTLNFIIVLCNHFCSLHMLVAFIILAYQWGTEYYNMYSAKGPGTWFLQSGPSSPVNLFCKKTIGHNSTIHISEKVSISLLVLCSCGFLTWLSNHWFTFFIPVISLAKFSFPKIKYNGF